MMFTRFTDVFLLLRLTVALSRAAEFDLSLPDIRRRLDELDAVCVNSNFTFHEGKFDDLPRHHVDVVPCGPPQTQTGALEGPAPLKIGWVGLCTESTTEMMAIASGGKPLPLRAAPVLEVAQGCVDALVRDDRPDFVVALTHQFVTQDRALAATCKGRQARRQASRRAGTCARVPAYARGSGRGLLAGEQGDKSRKGSLVAGR